MFILTLSLNIISIVSALLVITSESPIISVLYLIVVFICVACHLILAGLSYIGIVYIVVYVGAIAILFIFILMMINLQNSDIIESSEEFNIKVPLTLTLATLFFFQTYSIYSHTGKYIIWDNIPEQSFSSVNDVILRSFKGSTEIKASIYSLDLADSQIENHLSPLQHIQAIGENIYTQSSFWLILSSIIFLLGMISPIILSRKSQ